MDFTAVMLKLSIMFNYSKNQALTNSDLRCIYLYQMVPLIETFKRNEHVVKNYNMQKNILGHIFNIQNSSSTSNYFLLFYLGYMT